MMEPLTDGAIVKMNAGATSKELQPVLQIVDLKMVSTPQSAVDRYRVILSDGTHLQHAMLATQKNYLFSEGRVKKGTVVRMTEYSVNTIQHRLIIIVCDMIVIMDIGDIIGDPKPFSSSGAPASAPTTPNMAAGSLQNPRMDSVKKPHKLKLRDDARDRRAMFKQLNPLYCLANLTPSPPSSPIASPLAAPIAEELPTDEPAVRGAPPATDDWAEWREKVAYDIADLRSSLARLEDFAREADMRARQESEWLRTTLLSIIRGASAPVVAPPDDQGPFATRVASPLPSASTTRPGGGGLTTYQCHGGL
ncbi:unnamed protein product [Rhodiola kirilowii]